MSRLDDQSGEEDIVLPPFNLTKTYECFNEYSIPVNKWTKEECLVERFSELSLPQELYPTYSQELHDGAMLMMWNIGKDQVGFAMHKQPSD